MYHGKYARKRKPSILTWVLVCAALMVTVIGGVTAYLSLSDDLPNHFSAAPHPEVSVTGTTVEVKPNGSAVYLRVAVDASWKNEDGLILAEEPDVVFNTEGTKWKKYGDFYYFTEKILSPEDLDAVLSYTLPLSDPTGTAPSGYTLDITVAAQVIQAIGETDTGVSAVVDAWGVDPSNITD